jgi:hypothetical protein
VQGPNSIRRPLRARLRSLALSLPCLLGALCFTLPARAQSGYFYLDRAQISGAPDDGFMVFRPYVDKSMRAYGGIALGYAHNTLRAESVTKEGVLQNEIDNLVKGQFNT